ncbi:MAG: TOBE domain-containing protein [Burkholderiaceae bacterium]
MAQGNPLGVRGIEDLPRCDSSIARPPPERACAARSRNCSRATGSSRRRDRSAHPRLQPRGSNRRRHHLAVAAVASGTRRRRRELRHPGPGGRHGTIRSIRPGAVNAEVALDIDSGGQIVAIVTEASVTQMALAPGMRAVALIKAPDVILAVAT